MAWWPRRGHQGADEKGLGEKGRFMNGGDQLQNDRTLIGVLNPYLNRMYSHFLYMGLG